MGTGERVWNAVVAGLILAFFTVLVYRTAMAPKEESLASYGDIMRVERKLDSLLVEVRAAAGRDTSVLDKEAK